MACRVMVRMKVARKKRMMLVPRGQDMEEMFLIEESGGFSVVLCWGLAEG